jgi:hypothetical protein
LRFPSGQPLKKPFQFLLVLLGCLHLAGGPYSVLQAYAWIGMLVSYSQTDGLLQGAKDTFSGDKPCELCKSITSAREKEPDTKTPVAPVTSSSLSGKLIQEMLPTRETFLRPPSATDLPPVVFLGIPLPADFPKASPPVPPPCWLA